MNLSKVKRKIVIFNMTSLATLTVLMVLFPVLWVITTSLKPYGGLFTPKLVLIPENPTLSAFYWVLFESQFFIWLGNSLVVSIMTVLLLLLLSFPGAYALSRFKFFGKEKILYALLFTQFIPGVLTLIPLFTILARLRLLGSLGTLSLIYVAGGVPWSMWLLKTYLDGISREFDDSALMDGASYFKLVWRIMFPLSKPSVMVVAFLAFLGAMSEFLIANVVLTENWTLSKGLFRMIIQYQTPWNKFAAMSILIAVPILVVYVLGQRYLKAGLTLGGIRG